jgi:pimeloyl-ACP methyl ester carboxylesterase
MAGGTDEEVAVLRSIPEVWARLLDGARSEIVTREADELVARGWKPERYRAVAAPTLLLVGALTHSPLYAIVDDIHEAIPDVEVAVLDGHP